MWKAFGVAALVVTAAAAAGIVNGRSPMSHAVSEAGAAIAGSPLTATAVAGARRLADVAALEKTRPGYSFWRHVFSIPDGRVVFGSALDGRRLEVIRTASMDRRESIASELQREAGGPILHNETRGNFAAIGIDKYGSFLGEWAAIYERFGVPHQIGLAQAMIESGFVGTRRSEADAVGMCQFLETNWKTLDRLDPAVIEIENQTTQAAYCAAYLSILATKYGSFIPALSDHHAGGTNIGRVLVNGERLGGRDAREQYFLGSQLALTLRAVSAGAFSDIYGSYGPRSFRYAEMIFGNASRIEDEIASRAQRKIFGMRTSRTFTMDEIVKRTGLSKETIGLYNPALAKNVPAGATLYLPKYDPSFGADVTYWHRPAPAAFAALLDEFVSLNVTPQEWDTPRFAATLRDFARRFRETGTEEGQIMATVLAYARGESVGPRSRILASYRSSGEIQDLFERGVKVAEAAE